MQYKQLFLFLWFLLSGNFVCLLGQAQINAHAISNTYAIVIGITKYQTPAIPALQFADRDAKQFVSWLQSSSGGQVPDKHIKLLVNEEATIAAIYQALDWLKSVCKENDKAFIYFSGHGDVESKNNLSKGYLLAYNSPKNNYANNAISIDDFNNTSIGLTTKNKTKVIIISDACRSGKLAGDFFKGKQLAASQLRKVLNDQVRLASCEETELAAEGPQWGGGRGVFSYYLLLGLQGLVSNQNRNTVNLDDLSNFLNASFKQDKVLLKMNHKQHPVYDGNPHFVMSSVDSVSRINLLNIQQNNSRETSELPVGISALKPLEPQPLDIFYKEVKNIPIEDFIKFDQYDSLEKSTIPSSIIDECIAFQQEQNKKKNASSNAQQPNNFSADFNLDNLTKLSNELKQNKSINSRFLEKFIQFVHQNGQDMINAYLNGDIQELERRQYYYSGKRDYQKFISMLRLAIKVISPDHQLAHILKVNNFYLSGLILRLQMATNQNIDSLLNLAFHQEQQALALEPYGAYILNELGNLYLMKNNYDSAKYNFDLASVIAPTWAIPWSNKIRLYLAFNKLSLAEKEFKIADSIQSNLAIILTNAGLVMEKKGNYLSAISYYLRAIKENDIHYLPYERLGKIYMNIGMFDKADFYLYAANTRKKEFAINDIVFERGIAAGRIAIPFPDVMVEGPCPDVMPESAAGKLYKDLISGLERLNLIDKQQEGIGLLSKVILNKPDMPFANHYLGKYYYQQGNWKKAIAYLKKASESILTNDSLWLKISNDVFGTSLPPVDSCLLKPFIFWQYDQLEDFYLMASAYQNLNLNEMALNYYKQISDIENKRQLEQAGLSNYQAIEKTYKGPQEGLWDYMKQKTQEPTYLGGAIKAAQLYEKQGDYSSAEKVLINQAMQSQQAGNTRLKAINEKKPGWNLEEYNEYGFYWLKLNSYLEAETVNFYGRMIQLFPRESYWYEKAGLFIYNRLGSAFEQVPMMKRNSLNGIIESKAFPWTPSDISSGYFITLPGTNEEITIYRNTIHPVKLTINYINQALRFSGDIKPKPILANALASLYGWSGNRDSAIIWFNKSLNLEPRNTKQRFTYIEYMESINRYPEALNQLKLMYREHKISNQQTIKLADWQFLSGNRKVALTMLSKQKAAKEDEKREKLFLESRIEMMKGNINGALRKLTISYPEITISSIDDKQMIEEKKLKISLRYYSIARLQALQNNDSLALQSLRKALDNEFQFKNVLDEDEAWKTIRNSDDWNRLVLLYTYKIDNPEFVLDPSKYIVPALPSKQYQR